MPKDLLEIFSAKSGLVCLTGAGGKKSLIYRLAALHTGRVAITSTVMTPPFRSRLKAQIIIDEEQNLSEKVNKAALLEQRIAYACPTVSKARFGGVSPECVREIHQQAGFDLTLVKADGARMRLIKAPNEHEPVIPANADTVIPIVSAYAIGQPLTSEIAHRVDRLEQVTGASAGEVLTPEHIARLLASEEGALKGAGQAQVIPVINMLDKVDSIEPALQAATRALALTDRFDRVILTALEQPDPVVQVVSR